MGLGLGFRVLGFRVEGLGFKGFSVHGNQMGLAGSHEKSFHWPGMPLPAATQTHSTRDSTPGLAHRGSP